MTAREDFSFPSSDGVHEIAATAWVPEGGPWAVLQIAHGMQEHIGRYADFAGYLAERGFLVVGNDHLGHGRSASDEADLGYFGPQPSDLVVSDMNRLRMRTQRDFPGLPYFMLGHSMGSFMLRKYLALHGTGLAGAIVMGTGFTPEGATRAGLALVSALSKLRGERRHSALVANLAFGRDYRAYDTTGADPGRSWLSHDVENVRAYHADPRCGFPFTLNGYRGLLEAVRFSCRQENANAIPEGIPLLVVSGELDPVGGAGEGVRRVHRMLQETGGRDLTLKLYPGMLHEVLNEPGRAAVYADLAEWMQARL